MAMKPNENLFNQLMTVLINSNDVAEQMTALKSFGTDIDGICKELKLGDLGHEGLMPLMHAVMLESRIDQYSKDELDIIIKKLDKLSEPKLLDKYKTALPPLWQGLLEQYNKGELKADFTEKEMTKNTEFLNAYRVYNNISNKYDELITEAKKYQHHLTAKKSAVDDPAAQEKLKVFNSIYEELLNKPNNSAAMLEKMQTFSKDYTEKYHSIYKEPASIAFLKKVANILIDALAGPVYALYRIMKHPHPLWKPQKDKLAHAQEKIIDSASELIKKPKPS